MIANALPRPITAGSVDNAILRADGTGGSALQNSGLVVEDTIISFTSITGVASTDIITATGSAFANGQPVRFTSLTGGTGLNTTTNYFVINVAGATFQVSTSLGGGASLFTTNITAGTLLTGHSVSTNITLSENTTETNSALVLTPKGTGAFILGPKPDGTTIGGNARGDYARDFQSQDSRSAADRVASGIGSTVGGGRDHKADGNNSTIGGGYQNRAAGSFIGATVAGGYTCQATGSGSSILGGRDNTATGNYSSIPGGFQSSANRHGMQAYAAGQFSASGDAQFARLVLRCKTTTNTGVEMALDGATTYLGIPSGKVIAMTINISGVKSNGSAVAHYVRQYAVKNVGGTSSEVYAPVTIGTDNAAGTTIALSANNTDDTLRIAVTGIAAETWRWVASVDAVEIAYGT